MNRHKVPDDEALIHDVKTRITTQHFNRLQHLLGNSHYRTMSALLRDIICKGQVKIITKDESLDVVMEELVHLRKELNAIGNNLNQVARALNTPSDKGRQSAHMVELIGMIKELGGKMDLGNGMIGQLSKVWLQG